MTAGAAERLRRLPVAAIADAADGAGVLAPLIAAQTPARATVVAPAYTVALPPGDNLGLHQAVAVAAPGSAIVAAVGATDDAFGIWGEILATAATAAGIAMLVTDAWVRDRARLEAIGLPTYARGVCIRRTVKAAPGEPQVTVHIGDVVVNPSDLVCADADGIVVVAAIDAAAVAERAEAIIAKEKRVLDAVSRGETTIAALGLELHEVQA